MATDPHPIGLKIKRARERLLMSQAELGARIRKSQKTIDNWEHGRSYPKSSIGALEDVLGITLEGDPAPPEIDADMLEWVARKVPPEKQAGLIEAVRAALSEDEPDPGPPEAGRTEKKTAGLAWHPA